LYRHLFDSSKLKQTQCLLLQINQTMSEDLKKLLEEEIKQLERDQLINERKLRELQARERQEYGKPGGVKKRNWSETSEDERPLTGSNNDPTLEPQRKRPRPSVTSEVALPTNNKDNDNDIAKHDHTDNAHEHNRSREHRDNLRESRDKEREVKERERELFDDVKERERERFVKEKDVKERERDVKEREREKDVKERERDVKEREKERDVKEREKERDVKEREKERDVKERDKERDIKERDRHREKHRDRRDNERNLASTPHDSSIDKSSSRNSRLSSSVVSTPLKGGRSDPIDSPEMRQRNKKMFGVLLGTLNSFKRENHKTQLSDVGQRRKEVEQKIEDRVVKSKEQLLDEHRRKLQQEKEEELGRKEEIKKKLEEKEEELLNLRLAEHKSGLTKFLKTKAVPPVYWITKKRDGLTEILFKKQPKEEPLQNQPNSTNSKEEDKEKDHS